MGNTIQISKSTRQKQRAILPNSTVNLNPVPASQSAVTISLDQPRPAELPENIIIPTYEADDQSVIPSELIDPDQPENLPRHPNSNVAQSPDYLVQYLQHQSEEIQPNDSLLYYDRKFQQQNSQNYLFDFSKEQEVDMKCLEGHPLYKIPDLEAIHPGIYIGNSYKCSFCGGGYNSKKDPSSHCPYCWFDACPNCYKAQHNISQKCVLGHPLLRVTSLNTLYDHKVYIENFYICNCCGRTRDAEEDPDHHCPTCKFDICPTCFRQQQKLDYDCPSGHRLFKVCDLKTFNGKQAYNNNTYGCHFCKRILEAEEYPAAHCSKCRFDVCPDCIKANMISPNSEDSTSKQNGLFSNNQRIMEIQAPKENLEEIKKIDNTMLCVVCLEENRSCVLDPCRHLSTCERCSWRAFNDKQPCPVCRTEIKNVVRVFIV